MKFEFNFCYAETSKIIQKLGIRWAASHHWELRAKKNEYVLRPGNIYLGRGFPAYDITELGHMIPYGNFNEMKILKLPNNFFKVEFEPEKWHTFSSEAEARAQYLIWLVTIGKVEVEGTKKKEFVPVEEKPVEVAKPRRSSTKKIEVSKPKKRTDAKRAKVQPKLEQ